jgi:Curlin associated repeat
MKKTLLAILLTATLPVMAQTAVTAPSAATIPTMVTVSPNAAAALAISTTNRIFIDQSGDNPNVNMTQNGSGNEAGSVARPVYLRGIDQKIVTNQVGNNNEINLEVVNATTGPGVGATVTIQQIGNTNKADVACGYGNASDGSTALTGCKAADLNLKFTGNSNEIQYRGTGEDLKAAVDVTGNTNKFFIDAIGGKHTNTIKVAGDTNEFNINQRSTGAAGSSVWVDLTGNSNKFTVSQTGTIDNVVNIKSVSNSGIFNITQKN